MKFSLLTCLLVSIFPMTLSAQAPSGAEIAALAAKYHQSLAANREAMKNYSWQYRTEVWKNGELQWVDLVNANLNAQGLPILTQINREQITEQKRGLFSKPSQEKGFEEMDRIIEYLKDWVVFYNRMPLSRWTELFDQAVRNNAVKTAHTSGSLLQVSGTNIRDTNANDAVSLWFNKENAHPVQFAFTIPVEKSLDGATGESLTATIHYRYLRNGEAFYADHMIVTVPTRGLQIKIENLNMQKKL